MATLRSFVAIDGESFTNADSHDYVLLASSTEHYAYNPNGLSTSECFKYLLALRRATPNSIYVAFGLNYDVNMMLKDVGRDSLEYLWKHHKLQWRGYYIEWIPGKWFSVKTKQHKPCRIFDTFGFFQSSFLKALADWDIEAPATMEGMKESRHSFNPEMLQSIIGYCQDECAKLVELMNALRSALNSVGLLPQSWVGAGAIASALMRRESVKQFHAYDDTQPDNIQDALLRAYYGGRVELFQSGSFPRLTAYDVCSAYPSEALKLPALQNGTWKRTNDPTTRYGLSRVQWNVPADARVMPFPVRRKGNIYYPTNGDGWYHSPEIRVALRWYPDYIRVIESWEFVPDTDDMPFDFIRHEYAERARLKAAGDPAQKVVKLGLNSLYGKLAQGVGYQDSLPPFQSFHWAGRITSGTRAKLLDLACESRDSVVMIATDGIFYADPAPDFVTGKELGALELTEYTDCFVAQPGVYQATDTATGQTVSKSRGFFSREIDWNDIRAGWERDGAEYVSHYSSRRFLGLGGALSRRDLSQWRTWIDGARALSLYPSRKVLGENGSETHSRFHVPPTMAEVCLSDRYTPKGVDLEWLLEQREYVDGLEQPMIGE